MEFPRVYDGASMAGILCWGMVVVLVGAGVLSLSGPATLALGATLAMFVVVPLVARLADLPYRSGARSRWYRTAGWSLLPAAVAATGALGAPAGPVAALLAVPWLAVTCMLAAFGLERGLPNAYRPAELAVSAALLSLPLAGVSLVAHRAGVTAGIDPATVLSIVVHVSYAGCALPAFVGLLGREFGGSRVHTGLVIVVLAGPGLVGLAVATSQLDGLLAASIFTLLLAAVAVYALALVGLPERVGSALVAVAALSAAVSTVAVGVSIVAPWTVATPADFETALIGHGWLTAVGFAVPGLVGWRLLDPPSATPPLGMPVSRLTARGRVGADFLERNDLVADGDATGMVDGFSAFDGPACEATRVDPAVRAFYERTAAYDMRIEQTWERGFLLGARLYAALCRRIEQMNFPIETGDPSRLASRIVTVADRADGRENVRAWVRTYDETGVAIYVALYATHRLDGRPYMNIAFPLPFTNLTSVLTVEPLGVADPDGVVLSTRSDGDAGVYVRTPLGPLRLPMDETISVWAAGTTEAAPAGFGADGADLCARHDMFVFGRRFLQLDYRIDELADGSGETRRSVPGQ